MLACTLTHSRTLTHMLTNTHTRARSCTHALIKKHICVSELSSISCSKYTTDQTTGNQSSLNFQHYPSHYPSSQQHKKHVTFQQLSRLTLQQQQHHNEQLHQIVKPQQDNYSVLTMCNCRRGEQNPNFSGASFFSSRGNSTVFPAVQDMQTINMPKPFQDLSDSGQESRDVSEMRIMSNYGGLNKAPSSSSVNRDTQLRLKVQTETCHI